MTLSPAVRKLALTVHLTSSVGWIGAVLAYLALGVAAVTSSDTQTVRAAWTAMDLTGWWVIVPLALAALLTGLVMSLGTHWGLFRHYWVLISLGLTVLCTVVLVLHMPTVSRMASMARTAEGADLRALGGDLFHPGVGLLLLLAITVLNVYKPAGLTPYGWRRQREQRRGLQTSAGRARSAVAAARAPAADVHQVSSLRTVATKAGSFVVHFAEMWFAMFLGMAVFMVLRIALTTRGYTALLDATSIEFQVGMAVFMAAPMVGWMRLRGCSWRACAEMTAAMLVWTGGALVLRTLDLPDALLWLATNQHTLMLVGMLAVMLYRREHNTSGYSVGRWPSPSGRAAAPAPPEKGTRRPSRSRHHGSSPLMARPALAVARRSAAGRARRPTLKQPPWRSQDCLIVGGLH